MQADTREALPKRVDRNGKKDIVVGCCIVLSAVALISFFAPKIDNKKTRATTQTEQATMPPRQPSLQERLAALENKHIPILWLIRENRIRNAAKYKMPDAESSKWEFDELYGRCVFGKVNPKNTSGGFSGYTQFVAIFDNGGVMDVSLDQYAMEQARVGFCGQ